MATQTKTLNNTSYTLVSSGQSFSSIPDGMTVRVNVGTFAPSASTDLYHTVAQELNYSGSEDVYMMISRNTSSSNNIVVTEVV